MSEIVPRASSYPAGNMRMLLQPVTFALACFTRYHCLQSTCCLVLQGRYSEAEPLYRRSLDIRERSLGPEHPDVAQSLNDQAELLRAQVIIAREVWDVSRAT